MADVDYTANGSEAEFGDSQPMYEQGMEGIGNAGGDANPGDKINASKNDDDERKIFVGGLSWETTTKDLKDYFQKFGDVVDCTLKTDPSTGRSRGFGFVLFTETGAVDKVLTEPEGHTLHGRTIDPKRAKARGGREPCLKVFVGGLDPNVPEDDVRTHFSQYGKVTEIDLPYDRIKNQRRAFCFVTFESEVSVEKAVDSPKQNISGKQVDIKKATPKDPAYGGGYGGGRGGGYGGGGGGGGGRGGRGGRGRGRGRGGYDQGWGNDYYGSNYGSDYYSQGYGYGGYNDYSNYYGQNYGQGWGNQGYSGYGNQGNYGYGQYDQAGEGYDYSGWGYGNNNQGDQQQDSNYGKTKNGGSSNGSGGYHPYSR